MNGNLTARQRQILDLIQTAIARTGMPPTRAEIATHFGVKSANGPQEHLEALERKGYIELVSGIARGIRLTSKSRVDAQQAPLPVARTFIALPVVDPSLVSSMARSQQARRPL